MHHLRRRSAAFALAAAAIFLSAGSALAQVPHPWQIGFQEPGSPVAVEINELHNLVLVIITVISVFVAGLLGWVIWRYNAQRNPVPSRTSHNTLLEVAWTVIPILILVVMAIPSFRLVYYEDRTQNADMTLKVTAHQWYWEYTYPDQGNIDFSSYGVPDDQLKEGQLRMLAVDNQLVLPVGKNIRILTNSADVIHSFFIPSLGVQRYAIPGRTIETWVRIDRPGDYYGQCNQICGTNHDHMPISIHALSQADFDAWVVDAKKKFADAGAPSTAAITAPTPSGTQLRLAAAQLQH